SVVATIPIQTHRLDDIEGLSKIDWIALDSKNNIMEAVRHGKCTLAKALIVDASVVFHRTLDGQAKYEDVVVALERLGFRFLCFRNQKHHSFYPKDIYKEEFQRSQLI